MAKLILTFNEQVIRETPLLKEGITIGRNDDNTVVIDNLAVSGYHARIDKAGADFLLTDLQSTNGTFVNQEKVLSHRLRHGDKVTIGKHVLLFVTSEKGEATPSASQMDMDKTMMLDTANQREMLSRQKTSPIEAKASNKVVVISFVDGSGLSDIELSKELIKIGKSDKSDVKLSGMLMGATAATISRRPSGCTISYAGGMTKLKVNGAVVKESIALKDFDTIELGSHKFQFYQKDV